MTLQRFLRGYSRLCGMTGTAEGFGRRAAAILRARCRRHSDAPAPWCALDREDLVFTHCEAKERAIVEEIHRAHTTGRPVLVGTATGDRVGAPGRAPSPSRACACEVLNAKNDAEEAPIVARAGSLAAVTISTNMAGRGTDIRLGGDAESQS